MSRTDVDHPFLQGFAPAHRAALAELAREVRTAAGTRLFAEGDPATRFWLLLDGVVALDVTAPATSSGALLVETIGAGDVVGWSWLVPPHEWHFGGTCRTAVRALELDAAAVRQRCDDDPALGYAVVSAFLPVLTERLVSSRVRLLDLYAHPASGGLA